MPAIRRLLVANRGEIASRVFRTARSLGISTVAVHSDADAPLPYVREADRSVRLPGNAPADTYLNAEALLAAAAASGADAIHPGYGFLSENAAFARACAAAGVTFVGPPPEAIEAMGSKLEAKRLMAAHDVPVLPGGVVAGAPDVMALAEEIGWPLLLKASAGGGGRGMRRLDSPDDVEAAMESTRREALGAFGDGTLFVERLVLSPRHIEVQVLGDAHGNVIHLFERECSIQRRFQKIIEECPSPAVDGALRAALGEAAVRAARAIGYQGAGTVEFVVDGEGFYFLEVNTRLQVEHPVTEEVTGLDLVALQLLVAEGKALPPEAQSARIRGHAIEARLYAEDVPAGFLPVAGRLHRLEIAAAASSPAVRIRVDAGYESGSEVSPWYDAMLAKVIAWAPERSTAAAALSATLDGARLHGIATNRDLLVGVLRHADFLTGQTDTGFLTRHDPVSLSAPGTGDCRPAHAAAAALAAQAARRAEAIVQPRVPSGWRNVRDLPQRASFTEGEACVEVSYVVAPDGSAEATVGDEVFRIVNARPESVDLLAGDVRVRVAVEVSAGEQAGEAEELSEIAYVDSPLGHSSLTFVPRFPPAAGQADSGSLVSAMPGAVTRVVVSVGDEVAKGSVLMYLEAMKMEHPVLAPGPGVVQELRVSAGEQVEAGALLAVIGEAP